LGDTVDRFRRVGIARERPLDRVHLARAPRAGEIGVGAVGIDDATVVVGNHDALADRLYQRLAELLGLAAASEPN